MKTSLYILALSGFLALNGCQDDDLTTKETSLAYYIESFEVSGLGFEPTLKVAYEYDDSGRISKYTVLSYEPDNGMEEHRYFVFSWSDNLVAQIKGYLPGETEPYVEYDYAYLPDDRVSRITEHNHGTGLTSTTTFAYAMDASVKVSYAFSNGGSFEYEFDYTTGNILSDRTTRGSQLCSSGQYTYDTHRNPFKDLGYVDYLLTNLSSNNKLTEDISYVACSFPTLVPVSYDYEYNDRGYPVSATTHYKPEGSLTRSRKEFFYGSTQ